MKDTKNILAEAIVDAKLVRQAAIDNARATLDEVFNAGVSKLLSTKLAEDLDNDDNMQQSQQQNAQRNNLNNNNQSDSQDSTDSPENADNNITDDEDDNLSPIDITLRTSTGDNVPVASVNDIPIPDDDTDSNDNQNTVNSNNNIEDTQNQDSETQSNDGTFTNDDLEEVLRELANDDKSTNNYNRNKYYDADDDEDDDDSDSDTEDDDNIEEDTDDDVDINIEDSEESDDDESDDHEEEDDDEAKKSFDYIKDVFAKIAEDPSYIKQLFSVDENNKCKSKSKCNKKSNLDSMIVRLSEALRSADQEVTRLKLENAKYKKAIKKIRCDLNEATLLNCKLKYTTKLFKAKNLSESQKLGIINAFDRASNVNEALLTYKCLSDQFLKGPNNSVKYKNSTVSRVTEGLSNAFIGSTKPSSTILNENSFQHTNGNFFVERMQRIAGIK